jgi:hypothetical protein
MASQTMKRCRSPRHLLIIKLYRVIFPFACPCPTDTNQAEPNHSLSLCCPCPTAATNTPLPCPVLRGHSSSRGYLTPSIHGERQRDGEDGDEADAETVAPPAAGRCCVLFSTQQQQHAAADPGVLPGIKIRDSASR